MFKAAFVMPLSRGRMEEFINLIIRQFDYGGVEEGKMGRRDQLKALRQRSTEITPKYGGTLR